MQKDIHPEYREVVFSDITCDYQFVTKSTIKTKRTIDIDGVEYPLVVLDISYKSHPFYTGTQKLMDTAGRVERFYRKYGFERPADPDETPADETPADES
ncbi:MAG: large subunit ribosomal protein L31 [Kiritimatiellia bacterium]|jgi:large subunit ribosomal protein L31